MDAASEEGEERCWRGEFSTASVPAARDDGSRRTEDHGGARQNKHRELDADDDATRVQEWRRREKPCRFRRFAGPFCFCFCFCCDVARRTTCGRGQRTCRALIGRGRQRPAACGLLAPAVPPKPAKNIPNPHTLPTTQPHQVPTPAPSPRAASSWTVSTAPAVFLPTA